MIRLMIICLSLISARLLYAQNTEIVVADSLQNESGQLGEALVTASLLSYDKYGSSFLVSQALRERVSSPIEMLNHIDGVVYNEFDNTIKVRTDSRVLLMVNGIERDLTYIKGIPSERVAKIEVINVPDAKYVAEGYKFVINYKLKTDWGGHDLNLHKFNMLAFENNGDDIIANEQPRLQYMFTGKKMSSYIKYGFADIHWNYPISYDKSYYDKFKVTTGGAGIKNPNDENSQIAHNFSSGLEYSISPHHTVACDVSYLMSDDLHTTSYNIIDDFVKSNVLKEVQQENSSNGNLRTSLIYKGSINSKLQLYSAIGYNYVSQDVYNGYELTDEFKCETAYKHEKNYLRGELDVAYRVNENLRVNVGYIGAWNHIRSKQPGWGNGVSTMNENRQHAYWGVDYTLTPKALLRFGCGTERINNISMSWNWLPQALFSYEVSDKSMLSINYSSKMVYPKMYQMTDTSYDIDKYVVFRGNRYLSPARLHSLSIQGVCRNNLIMGVNYDYTHHSIAELYQENADKIVNTYANANSHYLTGYVAYDWDLNANLSWRNVVQISFESICKGLYKTQCTNWMFNSELNYWFAPLNMRTSISYLRNMSKSPLLQGWNHVGQDYAMLSLQKGFWGNRIFATVSYIPPLNIGSRTVQKSVVDAGFYKHSISQNLRTYDNMFMVRLQFKLSSNKKRKPSVRTMEFMFEDETKKDKGLL